MHQPVEHVTHVYIEVVDFDHGLWCTTCALSTGFRLWVTVRHGNRMHLQERLWCYEHEGSRGVVKPWPA